MAGEHAFLVYWRTLPWDHAPGVLLAEEAGCRARRPDGGDYSVGSDAAGLVVAHRSVIDDVRTGLFGR